MTGWQDRLTGFEFRLLAYLATMIGGSYLAGRLGESDCRRTAGEDGGLCGLAYLVWGPIAFVVLLVACVVVEIVVRRRRRQT